MGFQESILLCLTPPGFDCWSEDPISVEWVQKTSKQAWCGDCWPEPRAEKELSRHLLLGPLQQPTRQCPDCLWVTVRSLPFTLKGFLEELGRQEQTERIHLQLYSPCHLINSAVVPCEMSPPSTCVHTLDPQVVGAILEDCLNVGCLKLGPRWRK